MIGIDDGGLVLRSLIIFSLFQRKMCRIIVLLCLVIIPNCFSYENIHMFMSPEEVRQIFQSDVNTVPEYEIVKIHMPGRLHRRGLTSGSRLHITAFGENINLWIHPRDSILAGIDTPVYLSKYSSSAPGNVEFRRQYGLMEIVDRMFEDPDKMASLVIGKDDSGRTRINGYIQSHGIVVRSLPQRLVNEYSRRRRSFEDDKNPQYSPYHVVIKTNKKFAENTSQLRMNRTRFQDRFSRSVTEVPDTLYPEVLIMVDNSLYATFDTSHGHDIYGLLEYLLAFWNGVDLMYRSIETPRFRFNIAGIVLAEDPKATPYLVKNMNSKNAYNHILALSDFRLFLYKVKDTFPLGSYDIAASMTALEFGEDDSGVWGVAGIGSSCKIDHDYQTFESVTLSKDDGVFTGVHSAAHEIGHVLGSFHDNGDKCTVYDGFIMGYTPFYTSNSSDFSSCSIDQFQDKLDTGKYACFYNEPNNPGKLLPKLMPGRIKNLAEQCKNEGLGAPCWNETATVSLCVNIHCIEYDGSCRQIKKAALPGTECGKNKFCLQQQCVSL